MKPTSDKIWSLQALRFVAALMIVYVHAAQTAIEATGSGGMLPNQLPIAARAGVDIFFVLSGVIIAKTAPGLTWREFAWRRFRRVVPVYYLACIPAIAVAMAGGIEWRQVFSTFLLWPATDVMTAPLLPVAWTLCFEMLFYLAAALTLADRRFLIIVVAVFLFALGTRSSGPVSQFLGNPIIIEFAIGVTIAHLPLWRPAVWLIPVGAFIILWAGFVGLAPTGGTMEFLEGDQGFTRLIVYGVPSALIVFGVLQLDMKPNVWTYLGDGSYTLYLTHTFPITALLGLWLAYPIDPDIIIISGVVASILLAWRLYERVERPVLSFLRQYPPRALRPSRNDLV